MNDAFSGNVAKRRETTSQKPDGSLVHAQSALFWLPMRINPYYLSFYCGLCTVAVDSAKLDR